jgi:CDP-paratose 2-epimerase
MKKNSVRTALIVGGAGFIGYNLADRILAAPDVRVRIFDDLSRSGVVHNLEWLKTVHGEERFEFIRGDVREAQLVQKAASDADEIFHLAAQVAVTTSVDNPAHDFSVNALGTFNVLEAARRSGRSPFLLFTSTNKVYGALRSVPTEIAGTRYRASDPGFQGVDESAPLDFHSPYGCSKGAADQYVRDYARIYNLPTVVFRMSCIAGPRQFGNEDQGWVAHFLYSNLARRPITVYGNGFQVRDVLHVHDLVDAMLAARTSIGRTRGQIYNLGGGMTRSVSVVEALRAIEHETGLTTQLQHDRTRPGDQPLYIANTAKLEQDTGWRPKRTVADTIRDIHAFWRSHEAMIEQQHRATPERVEQEVA